MTTRIRLSAASGVTAGVAVFVDLVDAVVGIQKHNLSFVRQCGRLGDGRGRRLVGYGRGFGNVDVESPVLVRGGSGELKHAGLEWIVLEDAEDQLVLELDLCSGSLPSLLLSVLLVEGSGGSGRVFPLSEFPKFSCQKWVCGIDEKNSKVFR